MKTIRRLKLENFKPSNKGINGFTYGPFVLLEKMDEEIRVVDITIRGCKSERYIKKIEGKDNVVFVHEDDIKSWEIEQDFLKSAIHDNDPYVSDFKYAYGGWDNK